jgi:hypothetical protein
MKAGFENPSTKGEGRHIILAQYYGLQACNDKVTRRKHCGAIAEVYHRA